jgi:hypothetical protein
MACSSFSAPILSMSASLALSQLFPFIVVVGSLVGLLLGFVDFEVNSGCFTLICVVTYWWSVYLLPCLGYNILSQLLATPRSPTCVYLSSHTIHIFPCHHRKFGVFVTYPLHALVLAYVTCTSQRTEVIPHPIDDMAIINIRSEINLRQSLSPYLLPYTINMETEITMSCAPSLLVHAVLLPILLVWNACPVHVNALPVFSGTSNKCSYDLQCGADHVWNDLIHTFFLSHDPSQIMDFYNIFDHPLEGDAADWNGAPEGECVRNHTYSNWKANHGATSQFQPPSLWFTFLSYLRNGSCPFSCNISIIAPSECFTSIASDSSLLIIDSGASVCISPHRSDFLTYEKQHENQRFVLPMLWLVRACSNGVLLMLLEEWSHWSYQDITTRHGGLSSESSSPPLNLWRSYYASKAKDRSVFGKWVDPTRPFVSTKSPSIVTNCVQ